MTESKLTGWRPTIFWWSTWWRIGFGFHRLFKDRLDVPALTAYFMVMLDPRAWKLYERDHTYYDGPHDSLIIGPIQVTWDFIWCKKCSGEET